MYGVKTATKKGIQHFLSPLLTGKFQGGMTKRVRLLNGWLESHVCQARFLF